MFPEKYRKINPNESGWTPVHGVLPAVYKAHIFRINSAWEQARESNSWRQKKREQKHTASWQYESRYSALQLQRLALCFTWSQWELCSAVRPSYREWTWLWHGECYVLCTRNFQALKVAQAWASMAPIRNVLVTLRPNVLLKSSPTPSLTRKPCYWLCDWGIGVKFPAGAGGYSRVHIAQMDTAVPQVSGIMHIKGCSTWVKAATAWS
jgi:hypothetical protein